MKKKLFSSCLLLLLTSLLVVACGPAATPAPTATTPLTTASTATSAPTAAPTTAPTAAPKKVVTLLFTQEPDTLGPMYTATWYSRITQQIWNCAAWVYDNTNNYVPVLLTAMPSLQNGGVSADGKTITLTLRKDIVWSDGQPITSDDFVFTWQMYTNKANTVNSTYPYSLIQNMVAVDPTTVKMTFNQPFIGWEASLGHEILPAHILRPVFQSKGTLDDAAWNRAPTVGCGPYVFAEWQSGSFMRFERNPTYYNPAPKIDEIFIRFVPDEAAQTAALISGEGDLGAMVSYSDIAQFDKAGVTVVPVVSGYNEGWYFYMGNNGHAAAAIQDVKVRQATALCFDRFSLVKSLLLGKTGVAASFWQNTPWQDPTLQPWPYDPTQGEQLLQNDGWVAGSNGIREKNGLPLELTMGAVGSDLRNNVMAIAQQDLATCGIKLDTKAYTPPVFYTTYGNKAPCSTGELDICESSRAPSWPDPDVSLFLSSQIPTDASPAGLNVTRLSDPQLDQLFSLEATQVDPSARQQTFYQISKLMTQNVYWLGLWNDPDLWAYNSRLTGVKFSGAEPFYNVTEWDVTK